MSFISYAQNYEDVMLWRALKHVKNGFYIDVGANDPVEDSVTKAFYDAGWKGINIEPLKSHYQDLVVARPNDINLLCAAGSVSGQVALWECEVRGWATSSPDVILQHKQAGYTGVLNKVPVFPLADICEQHVQGEIHFLKIDVEGYEKDVLKGMNFKKFRPWIVVVEATKPNSAEETHDEWEALIVKNSYVFAYADGLNRFYVSKERTPNLLNMLRNPPNIFDNFIQFKQLKSELRAQGAETKAKQEETRLNGLIETRNAELKIIQEAFLDQKAQIEWLQNEWTASRERVDVLNDSISQAKQEETRLNGLIETRNFEIEDLIVAVKSSELNLIDSSARNDELNRLLNECKGELEQVHHSNHTHWLEVQNLRVQLDKVMAESQTQGNLVHERQKELNSILNSLSWRITHPLRVINKLIHELIGLPKIIAKSILVSFMGWISKNQLTKTFFKKVFNTKFLRNSKLKNYIKEFAIKNRVNVSFGLLAQENVHLNDYPAIGVGDSEKSALFFLNKNEIKIYMELKNQLHRHSTNGERI